MTLQEFFDFVAKQAAIIFHATGSVSPMWHAIDDQGEPHLVLTPWDDANEKRAMLKYLREEFRKKHVVRYAFMTEAWTVEVPSLRAAKRWIGRFQEHPDRREILAIQAEDRDGAAINGWYYILRPEHGPAKLSPLQMQKQSEYLGQMMGMLK